MRLLHISDIHFNHTWKDQPDSDPDHHYRDRLRSAVRLVAQRERVFDALLVTGDIAYCGHPDEYVLADAWLQQLMTAANPNGKARLLVVPGNHDVDRLIARQAESRGLVSLLNQCSSEGERQKELISLLRGGSGSVLLAAHAAYSKFAAKYNCEISPTRLAWTTDLPMGEGLSLRVIGMTSSLLCGQDVADEKGRLLLGTQQANFTTQDGIINAVLCHHPLDWMSDGQEVENRFTNAVPLQFFGHMHTQREVDSRRYHRFLAGAVNPERYEKDWRPAFNVVDLQVEPDGARHDLIVQVQAFAWEPRNGKFQTTMNQDGQLVSENRIRLPEEFCLAAIRDDSIVVGPAPVHQSTAVKTTPMPMNEVVQAVNTACTTNESEERILCSFMECQPMIRRDIAQRLGLWNAKEARLAEPHLSYNIVIRAHELGLMEQLQQEISKKENQA